MGIFTNFKASNDMKTAKKEIIMHLQNIGYKCSTDQMFFNEAIKLGRLSIYAQKDNQTLAIELTDSTPSKYFKMKLYHVTVDHKAILILGGDGEQYKKNGIAIVPIKLRTGSF